MAVIEFLNMETEQAFNRSLIEQHLPNLPAKIAYQKVVMGKAVLTLITKE